MAVLPSDSAHAIPKAGRWLMSDIESPIIDFYPSEVPVDPNGKAMPWLWVVLLPFIDEERLLAAMSPTMAKWTKGELLCNARGLDDGYVYLHSSHPLAPKFKQVLESGKNPKAKQRLTDAASYGCPGFTGSLRPPLSNEIVPEGQNVPAPELSSKAVMSSDDNLFTDDIHENVCACVAFTEPAKLSHKSIMLPGTIPPPPELKEEDKRICRPRLNRGGQSIAYMGGGGQRQSHQSGRGSMNISSYERQLAQQNGRGNDMNKAGTRTWGSFEPTAKRQYRGGNPFQRNKNGVPPPPPPPPPPRQGSSWQQQNSRQGYNQYHQNQQQQQYSHRQGHSNNYHSGQQHPPRQMHHHGQQRPPSQNNTYRGQGGNRGPGGYGYNQHSQHQQQPGSHPGRGRQQQSQQGFNFRSYNQASGPSSSSSRPQQPSSAVNSNVMNSLKNQLKNTLKQNRNRNN